MSNFTIGFIFPFLQVQLHSVYLKKTKKQVYHLKFTQVIEKQNTWKSVTHVLYPYDYVAKMNVKVEKPWNYFKYMMQYWQDAVTPKE